MTQLWDRKTGHVKTSERRNEAQPPRNAHSAIRDVISRVVGKERFMLGVAACWPHFRGEVEQRNRSILCRADLAQLVQRADCETDSATLCGARVQLIANAEHHLWP